MQGQTVLVHIGFTQQFDKLEFDGAFRQTPIDRAAEEGQSTQRSFMRFFIISEGGTLVLDFSLGLQKPLQFPSGYGIISLSGRAVKFLGFTALPFFVLFR